MECIMNIRGHICPIEIAVSYVLRELAPSCAFTRIHFCLYGYIVRIPRFVSWDFYLFGSKLLMRNATALAKSCGRYPHLQMRVVLYPSWWMPNTTFENDI